MAKLAGANGLPGCGVSLSEVAMGQSWTLSGAAATFLGQVIAEFEARGMLDAPVYPSVMWSLGGKAWERGDRAGSGATLPAEYAVGFYKRDPLPAGDRLMFLPSKEFGLIVFLPSDDDLASSRRLIDYDGKDIVVR